MKLPIFNVLHETAMASDFALSSDADYTLANMRTCRTSERGGQILCCPDCGTAIIRYNPCNKRGCPTCYKKNQLQWKNKRQKKLLPVSHYHLVFSIPQVFVITWLLHKRALSESLLKCVGQAISELGKEYGLLLGYVLAFHSHGKSMCYKPHVHCALTAGGMDDNKKWIEIGSLEYTKLVKKIRETFYQILSEHLELAELPVKKAVNDREWTVYSTMHQKTGKWIMEYLSHSVSGVVIDMHQEFIINKENKTVTFSEEHSGKKIETVLSNRIFTERYLNHIPPSREVMIRYYGLYANLHAEDLETIRNELVEEISEEEELDEEIKENICPVCHGQLCTVITFLPNELPLFIKYTYVHGPPEHNEIIKKGKIS